VVRDMQKDFHRVVSIADNELRVSTESEREERRRKRDEERENDG
jgi:hypothetical protein